MCASERCTIQGGRAGCGDVYHGLRPRSAGSPVATSRHPVGMRGKDASKFESRFRQCVTSVLMVHDPRESSRCWRRLPRVTPARRGRTRGDIPASRGDAQRGCIEVRQPTSRVQNEPHAEAFVDHVGVAWCEGARSKGVEQMTWALYPGFAKPHPGLTTSAAPRRKARWRA